MSSLIILIILSASVLLAVLAVFRRRRVAAAQVEIIRAAEQHPLLRELTLIIPTLNRHDYLPRAIDYYKGWNLRFIVADSTRARFHGELPPHVEYIHLPHADLVEKFRQAVELVKTPYVLLSADDDLISPPGVIRALEFMREHPECACAQGLHAGFACSVENQSVGWYSAHYFAKDIKVDATDAATRLVQQCDPYMNNFYAMHTTRALKDTCCRLWPAMPSALWSRHLDMVELAQALNTVTWGSHVVLPCFWIGREAPRKTKNLAAPAPSHPEGARREDVTSTVAFVLAHAAKRIEGTPVEEQVAKVADAFTNYEAGWNSNRYPHIEPIEKIILSEEDKAALRHMDKSAKAHLAQTGVSGDEYVRIGKRIDGRLTALKQWITGSEMAHVLRRTMASIGKYVLPYKTRLILSILLGMSGAAFNGLMLIGFQLIFSLVLKGQTRTFGEPVKLPLFGKINIAEILGLASDAPIGLIGVVVACAFIPVLIFVRGFLTYLSVYMQAWVASKVVFQIRNDTYRSILRQSPAFFSNSRTGELMQTVTYMTSAVHQNAMLLIQTLAQRPLTIISILVVLFAQDWVFTTVSLLVFPACMLPIIQIGKRARKAGQEELNQTSGMAVVLQESFSGIRLVKSYAREQHECQRFEDTNSAMVEHQLRWTKQMEIIGPTVEAVASIGIAAGLVYAWQRGLEAENFFLLVMALTQIYPPLKELSRVQLLFQRTGAAAEQVFQLLEKVPDIQDAPDAVDIGRSNGSVEFRNVTFAYTEQDGTKKEVPAVKGIHLQLDPGRFYAFVGPSGAGKSTLYSLLLRFYDTDEGAVLLDGKDIRSITLTSLRSNIGVVSQDTFLFHDTIKENIRYGRLDATDEEVIEAAKKAYAHDFIMENGGYEAVVGEGGCKLSGGQKQRISIARAILRNAPVLLLDEATSALDTESEKVIQEAIHTLSEGKTVVAIAHRLSTILEADQIVVMDKGLIVDRGTHAELLERAPLYQKLYNLQFSSDDAVVADVEVA